jgi:hypothetical protein
VLDDFRCPRCNSHVRTRICRIGVFDALILLAAPPLSRRLFHQQPCKGLFPLLGRLSHTLKKDR